MTFTSDILASCVVTLLLALAVEAVTEIVTSSKLTEPIRELWKSWTYPIDAPPDDSHWQAAKVWVDYLLTCGYCSSVWIAGLFAIWAPKIGFGWFVVDWLCMTFFIHRIANWIHVAYELLRKGRVRTYDIELKVIEEVKDGSVGEGVSEETTET